MGKQRRHTRRSKYGKSFGAGRGKRKRVVRFITKSKRRQRDIGVLAKELSPASRIGERRGPYIESPEIKALYAQSLTEHYRGLPYQDIAVGEGYAVKPSGEVYKISEVKPYGSVTAMLTDDEKFSLENELADIEDQIAVAKAKDDKDALKFLEPKAEKLMVKLRG